MNGLDVGTLHRELLQLFEDEFMLEVDGVDADLFEAGLVDSVLFVRLLAHLESSYGIEIPLETLETERLGSIDRIAHYVVEMRG